MKTTLIKVGEGYELRTTNRSTGDQLVLLPEGTPIVIAGETYKRQRLSTGRTRQGYSGFFVFAPHEFVPGAADAVACLDGLLEEHQIGCHWPKSHYSFPAGLNFPCTAALVEPETKTWNGEGLPPIGIEVEVLWSSTTGEYVTAKVTGHDEGRAVYRFTSGERKGEYQAERAPGVYDFLPNIRPIRTAEQLAAEQREVEEGRIKEALRFYCVGRKLDPTTGPNITYAQMAQALYAAGARFPEAK